MFETVKTTRDCEATEIPSGHKITLPAGTEVRITQVAGNSYTVMSDLGFMASVAGKDADAIGKEPLVSEDSNQAGGTLEEQVEAQLKTCFDPEIPINIVDLGLIYDRKFLDTQGGGRRVEIKMTLTAPGCGMGEWLKQDIEAKLLRLAGIKEVGVELVWDPPWDRSRMSEAAKLQLGMM
ncbi:MAG: putative Fe-S cluster assembly protein SufT [Candidatus Omnitrophica bacterium]|nr:putative Fe-S cluster assembly protein SufT [Candidatus Omnitrophota bacterium]